LWQIHAFGEGNTRTTAVFAIKYLRTFGYSVNNELLANHSWYFRNALVRANFNDYTNNIKATTEFLMKFFGNLLLGENNELKNRTMHIKFTEQDLQIHNKDTGKNETVEKILEIIKNNPQVTQKELSELTGLSRRGVEWNITQLKQKRIIERVGADRGGSWKIIQSTI
jgi:Fic family protein